MHSKFWKTISVVPGRCLAQFSRERANLDLTDARRPGITASPWASRYTWDDLFPNWATLVWEMAIGALYTVRSHSAGYEPNAPYGPRGVRENKGRSPRMGDGEVLAQSIRMIGQFLHLRQGDHEQMASRATPC